MQSLTAEDKKELCKDAFQDISSILAGLRDQGLSDLEIFEFGKSLIDHFDPIKMEILKKESDYQDALFREANDPLDVFQFFFLLVFLHTLLDHICALLFKKI